METILALVLNILCNSFLLIYVVKKILKVTESFPILEQRVTSLEKSCEKNIDNDKRISIIETIIKKGENDAR